MKKIVLDARDLLLIEFAALAWVLIWSVGSVYRR